MEMMQFWREFWRAFWRAYDMSYRRAQQKRERDEAEAALLEAMMKYEIEERRPMAGRES